MSKKSPSKESLVKLVRLLQDHTDKSGRLVSELFLELPSKEDYPDYYELIKQPIALDGILDRVESGSYGTAEELRRDVRQMVDNAQTYNMKGSGVYKDAQTLWNIFDRAYKLEFGLADAGSVGAGGRKSLGGGERASSTASSKRASVGGASSQFMGVIEQLLQLRKGNRRVCELFEVLPSKEDYPDYYELIDSPISFEEILQKLKEGAYKNLPALEEDVRLMVENAKTYNEPGSFVYNDAVDIWNRFYELTKSFRGEEKPLGSVSVGGHTYHAGDYVYLQNDQDKLRPLVLLIHRVFQAGTEKYIYGNYFLRPVQTVHPAKRRFFKNEVFKSDRFVTLPVSHIQGSCCVLYLRDYQRGRPKEFANTNQAAGSVMAPEKEADVYVCESRYIERGQKMEKIISWLQNMPDRLRLREKGWEQTPGSDFLLFPRSLHVAKEPSPFAHLAEDNVADDESTNAGKSGAASEVNSEEEDDDDDDYYDDRKPKRKSMGKQRAAAAAPPAAMPPPGMAQRGVPGMSSQQAAMIAQQQQFLQAQQKAAGQRPAHISQAQWAAMHPNMRMQVQQQIHLQMLQQQRAAAAATAAGVPPVPPGYPGAAYGGVGRPPATAPGKIATDTLPEVTAQHFEQRDGKVVWYPGPPLILVRPPRAIHSLAYQAWRKEQKQNSMDVDKRPKSPVKKRQRVDVKAAPKVTDIPWESWKKSLNSTSDRLLQESKQLIAHLAGSNHA